MKKNITILSALLFTTSVMAQVGINNTTPKATLDVSASPDDLTKTDGIIIPRIEGNQLFLKNDLYGADQTATLIYVTAAATGTSLADDTVDVTEAGYYMHNGTKWVKLNAGTSAGGNDWTLSGNTTNPTDFVGTINDQPLNFKINNESSGIIDKYNSSYGYLSLSSNISGLNAAFGTNTLSANTQGSANNAFGYDALSKNTTGHNNSAMGTGALSNNTTGFWNSAFGNSALNTNITGNSNSAFGIYALRSNIQGTENNAFGGEALYSNTTGNQNQAFGTQALRANTTGRENNAVGAFALANNTTGSYNIATGNYSLTFNTGNYNNAFGHRALGRNTEGSQNVAIGTEALSYNIIGNFNTAIGNKALEYIRYGSHNTAIGYQAGTAFYSYSLTNTTAIGSNAIVASDNSIVLGGTAGPFEVNVGINTTTPKAKLHIIKNVSQLTPAIIEGCNVYDSNDEAITAGLPSGAIYRTSTGVLMVRY